MFNWKFTINNFRSFAFMRSFLLLHDCPILAQVSRYLLDTLSRNGTYFLSNVEISGLKLGIKLASTIIDFFKKGRSKHDNTFGQVEVDV